MDNMPDFDSMTPEEMMAWMEALAKRQGATEGLVTSGDVDVPEIDPDSVAIDEPGYIPFGMDPEVWAQKKAKEDAERAERIAAMRAQKASAPPETTAPEPAAEAQDALDQTNPLEFLAEMSAVPDAPTIDFDSQPLDEDLGESEPIEAIADAPAAAEQTAEADEVQLEDLFADLADAQLDPDAGEVDWLADLGHAAADLSSPETLDFGSLEGLDESVAEGDSNPLEWLESLVSGDSDRVEAVAEAPEDDSPAPQPTAAGLDDMLLDDQDILEDSAVSAVLNDPMDWLADFAEAAPMDELARRAGSEQDGGVSDLDSFFDRLQSDEGAVIAAQPTSDIPEAESGLLDFGDTPSFEEPAAVESALPQGENVPPEEMKAWMDSLLDRGIQRTDVTDDIDEESEPIASDLPDWLVEQVGTAPAGEDLLAGEGDLPDWLTAPVTDAQNLEIEEMFSGLEEQEPEVDRRLTPEFDIDVAPLDTGAIRVQMNDPWVEAFELERDEKMSDTGRLAAWYESAAHEVRAAREAEMAQTPPPSADAPTGPVAELQSAELPSDDELPAGEPQSIPSWLGVEAVSPPASPIPAVPAAAGDEEDLPDWLRAAQVESDEMAEVPAWLTDSLSTDEFEILQIDREGQSVASNPVQDEPTAQVSTVPAVQPSPVLAAPTSTPRPTAEGQRARADREAVPVHEAANVIHQARASQKMGDVAAMLDAYQRLIRSEVALEEVEVDMERVSKDPVYKGNPSVLRVYGDVLLRRGKLQQALDTYRSALNLL